MLIPISAYDKTLECPQERSKWHPYFKSSTGEQRSRFGSDRFELDAGLPATADSCLQNLLLNENISMLSFRDGDEPTCLQL